ncbi:MAG TPA: KEOPS complex kinase/ATPase Bud32 [Candidatus Nanoarchaeia archaeon]|nr:KEOPS complex kinase/ATPase Bud32 [Candidatus Nanoarchaeia archaeon]
MQILKRGAEAILYKEGKDLVKERISKGYRIPAIDYRLRKERTRSEAKILEKVRFAPKLIDVNEKLMTIKMEFLKGKLIKDIFDRNSKNEMLKISRKIGERVAELHDANIIHGDLTTSNMILKNNAVYFIDFGLSYISTKEEDKAVDIHLLRQALESKHWKHYAECYKETLKGYGKSSTSKAVTDQLKKVEARGRYKS